MSLPETIAGARSRRGPRCDAEVAQITRHLCAPAQDRAAIAALTIQRDIAYGAAPRHRLDLYDPHTDGAPRPVVLFVHGGAFVAGDKTASDGAPFYENVGLWAVRHGCAAIAMTYRLAPEHPYPAGAEDIAAAIAWVHREGPAHGLDPARLILMGQSAGAVHVATYLAQTGLHEVAGGGVRAGVLISGLYDMSAADDNPPKRAYFGADPTLYPERSSLEGLRQNCDVPLLIAVCEYDPPDFQNQALILMRALFYRDRRLPQTLYLSGHNHLSAIFLLGSATDTLGPTLGDFIIEITKE